MLSVSPSSNSLMGFLRKASLWNFRSDKSFLEFWASSVLVSASGSAVPGTVVSAAVSASAASSSRISSSSKRSSSSNKSSDRSSSSSRSASSSSGSSAAFAGSSAASASPKKSSTVQRSDSSAGWAASAAASAGASAGVGLFSSLIFLSDSSTAGSTTSLGAAEDPPRDSNPCCTWASGNSSSASAGIEAVTDGAFVFAEAAGSVSITGISGWIFTV